MLICSTSVSTYIICNTLSPHNTEAFFCQAVISKERVGNSWDIVNTIFGHEYHHKHSNRFILTYQLKPESAIKKRVLVVLEYFCLSVGLDSKHNHTPLTFDRDLVSRLGNNMLASSVPCAQYNQSSTWFIYYIPQFFFFMHFFHVSLNCYGLLMTPFT